MIHRDRPGCSRIASAGVVRSSHQITIKTAENPIHPPKSSGSLSSIRSPRSANIHAGMPTSSMMTQIFQIRKRLIVFAVAGFGKAGSELKA
ncbi:MAG: hypothetical protein H7144_17690 [Burkholderiales bacterium]|nr:hypothetical protein [Phycisphaerae bacterium]